MSKALAGWALGLSIGGFLLGWIPVFGWLLWLAGLLLSIVAVAQCKQGRGMAIAALIISILGILILASFLVFSMFMISSTETFLPDKCTLGPEFMCTDFSADNGLQLTIRNNNGVAVQDVRIQAVGGCEGTAELGDMENGESKTVTVCNAEAPIDVDIEIVYEKDTITHSSYGSAFIS